MVNTTNLNRENIFRNTSTWYAKQNTNMFSSALIRFCQQYAGNNILDLGCAIGNYCSALSKVGFKCTGVDINESYVKIAREHGVNAHLATFPLFFDNGSFDTVIMFEVLEHVPDPDMLLIEAKRMAVKSILITVPNCSEFNILNKMGLMYNHFLEEDHINFFTKKELESLLANHFDRFKVEEREPIWWAAGLPWWLRKSLSLLYRMKMIKPRIFYRLYAVIELKTN